MAIITVPVFWMAWGLSTSALPLPNQAQEQYIEREIGALITWAIDAPGAKAVQACTGCNWGLKEVTPAKLFNPTSANATQWVRAAQSFGAKSLTLAVNHCGGFAMWPTNVTIPNWGRYNYSVAYAGDAVRHRDLVREFVDACTAAGLAYGFYVNIGLNFFLDVGANSASHSVVPRGRNQMCWDPRGFNASLVPGQARVTRAQYEDVVMAMLGELLGGGYGHDMAEIWLDGGYPASMEKRLATLLDRNQPHAVTFQGPSLRSNGFSGNVVRWAGTETGHTPSSDMWSTTDLDTSGPSGKFPFGEGPGSADGVVFMPAEQDAAIQAGANEGGFWYKGETAKSVNELVSEYEDSVGHNSNYCLELSPDRDGVIPGGDLKAYAALGRVLGQCYDPRVAVGTADGNRTRMTIDAHRQADRILIKEDEARSGARVRQYSVMARMAPISPSTPWVQVAQGHSVGHARIHRLDKPLPALSEVKLQVTRSEGVPQLRSFLAFDLAGCMGSVLAKE